MNTIQAALAKIGNLARQKFGDNEGFIQNNKVTFQPIRQAVSSPTNLAYTTSKLFTGNPLTRQQFTQAVQPIAKAYTKLPRGVQKFGEGFYEGNTLGLSDMNVPASTNWGEKIAYGSGYTASMLNPLNPINKVAKALKGTQTVKLLQKPMGQLAGNLIARGGGMKLLGRGIANVAQGIPYTAAYAGVNLLNRKPQDVANDAIQNAAGDLLLGGTPLVGGLLIKSGAGRKLKSAKTVATTATKKLVQEASDIAQAKAKGLSFDDWVKGQGKNNPLFEAAKDFEDADDFISFYRGSSTQYGKYRPELRKFGTTEESIRVPELGVDPEKKITIYRGLDESVGRIKGKINDGDFVTTDLDSANAYSSGKVISKEVKAKDLIIDYPEKSDFENPFYKGAEFIYSDSKNKLIKYSDKDLTDIFEKSKSYKIKVPLEEWEKQLAYIQKKGEIPPNADIKGFYRSPEYGKYGSDAKSQKSAYYEYVSNKIDDVLKTRSQLKAEWDKVGTVYDEVIKPTSSGMQIDSGFGYYDTLPAEPKGSRKIVKIIGANPSPNDMIVHTDRGSFQRNNQTIYKKVPIKVLTEIVAGRKRYKVVDKTGEVLDTYDGTLLKEEVVKILKQKGATLIEESKPKKALNIAPTEDIPSNLLAEARKYKSVDEFVKARQPSQEYITVYHRTNTPIDQFGKTPIYSKENAGEFFVSNKKIGQAEGYGKNVLELRVKKSDLSINDEFPSGEKHYTIPTKIADEAIKTKSQLTDIWNQAQGKSVIEAPQPTAPLREIPKEILSQPDKPFVPEMGVLDQDLGIGNPKLKQRGFVTSVKEADFSEKPLKQGVKGVYEPITNKQTMQKAENLIKTDIDTALDKIYNSNEYSAETVALGLKVMAKAQREGNHQIAVNVAETLATKATKAGQSIQALSILSRLTPTGMLRYAVKQINAANENQGIITKGIKRALKVAPAKLSEKSAKRITTLMNLANTATTEEYQSRYTRMAMDEIASKLPYGISDLIDEMRYNNMLSSIGTHLRNGWSNLWQVGVIRPSTLLFQGQPKSVANYYKGVVSAIPQAVDKALIAISGKTPYKPIEMELGRKLRPKPRLGLYNIPTRLLEASDQFFTTMVKSGEIARGATPKDAEKLAENLLFRSGTKLENQGALLNKIDDLTIGVENLRKVGLGWFIPFIRTPMNVAKQWIEYSPAGVFTLPGAKNKKEQLAKAMVGSVVTLIGAKAAMEGRTTWAAPTDPTEKKLFYDSGRKPYSVKVGNKWIPMQYLGSTAWAFGIPAAVKYYQDDQRQALTDDQVNKLTSALLSLGGFWSQQTFVSGLGSFVNVAQGKDDYTLSKSLAYTGSQIIPFSSLQRYIANIIDPVFRKPKDVVQQVKSGIPFMTKDLPYYETSTGEPAKRNITNYIAPYAMGFENKQFEQPYQERKQRIQENALINAVKNSPSQYTPQDITRTQTIESQRAVQEDMDRYAKRIDTYLALPSDNKTRTSKIKRVKTEIINNDTLPETTKQELLKKLPEIKEEVKAPKKAKAKKVKKAKIKKVKKAKLKAIKIKKPKVVKAKKIKVAKVKTIKMPKLAVKRLKTQRRAYA